MEADVPDTPAGDSGSASRRPESGEPQGPGVDRPETGTPRTPPDAAGRDREQPRDKDTSRDPNHRAPDKAPATDGGADDDEAKAEVDDGDEPSRRLSER